MRFFLSIYTIFVPINFYIKKNNNYVFKKKLKKRYCPNEK